MASSLHAALPCLANQLKLRDANPSDLLVSKLWERARSSYETDENSSMDSLVVDQLLDVEKSPKVFGRTSETDELISQLVDNSNIVEEIAETQVQISVIVLVGVGGIGKTTLARMVYEDKRVQEHFDLKAWVKMGGQEQNQLHVARRLLISATGVLCTLNSLDQLDEMIFDAFLSKRILIVLDDVESITKDSWLHMKNSWFSSVGFGSKVIITTRKQKVIDDEITKPSEQFPLGKLSESDSWSLFRSLAFTPSDKTEHYRLIPAARRLADRCNGVPLYLKLLGSLIRFEKSLLVEETYSTDLMEIIKRFQDDSFVLPMCVLALPNELFKCLAYCGIFPSGYVMDKEKVIKMWIADGLVKPAEKQNLEDIGEAYFHQFVCRSFFVDVNVEHDEIVQARMPSVVYEISKQIAAIMFENKVGYVSGIDKNLEKVSVASPFKIDKFEHLQTLVSLPTKNLVHADRFQSFADFKRLQSLDLSRSRIRTLSKYICSLRKLKYLNLSHTLVTKLPKSITNLTRLQTLDLSSCYFLQSLPSKTSSLSQLRHLDLSQCNSLYDMPPGIGRLVSLVTLNLYVLGGADLGELHGLNDIRGVLHIRNLENVKQSSEAEAAGLLYKKLHHLGLSWSQQVNDSNKVLESLKPNPQLRFLELTGYGGSEPPPWVPTLHNLVKLLIEDCNCSKLPTLGQLPSLQELQLKELSSIKSIGEEFYGNGKHAFPSLAKLKLHGMRNLKCWSNAAIAEESTNSRSVFPILKSLSIQDCPELQTLPSSLQSVRELVVWRSHSQLLMDTGEEWLSISSIVINDMDVKEWVRDPTRFKSVKKLVLVSSRDLSSLESSHIDNFTDLQHLRIFQCFQLKSVKLTRLGCLQKLNILDCQSLLDIDLVLDIFTFTELVVEDCPRLTSIKMAAGSDGSHLRLRKLVVRNCPLLSIETKTFDDLRELEMFFINGCPRVEERLNSLKFHLPFVIIRAENSIKNHQ